MEEFYNHEVTTHCQEQQEVCAFSEPACLLSSEMYLPCFEYSGLRRVSLLLHISFLLILDQEMHQFSKYFVI